MSLRSRSRARASPRRRIHHGPTGRRRSRRGVSDVVATILILALTVTLFASIFAFVGSFPAPPPQNVNQFQASLVYTTNQSYISGLKIDHLAGPSVSGTNHVYLESSTHEPNWQFSVSGGIPIYWGLSPNSSSTSWNFGQYWSTTFTKLIKVPDNITIYVLTPNQLLYSVVLPGLVIDTPPAILSSGISPSTLSLDEGFEVYASLGGTLTGLSAKVNLGAIPGLTGNKTLTLQTSGLYTYSSTSGPTESGTWYALIYVTNIDGQVASTTVPVVVSSSSGGGGGSGSTLSVSVGMTPAPSNSPAQTGSSYFWATVSYTGSNTAKTCINFTAVNHFSGREKASSDYQNTSYAGNGAGATTCETITGPTTLTIYSATEFNLAGLVSGSAVTVTASETSNSLGTASGTLFFDVSSVAIGGYGYFTTSSSGATSGNETSFSHSCATAGAGRTSNCPYLYYDLWDHWTAGPSSLTFTGGIYVNSTTGGYTYSKTFSTSITSGSASLVDPAGTTTRWPIPGGASGTIYNIILVAEVLSGTTVIGYLYDHVTITLT